MNGWALCLLVLLLVIASCDASKFKELYPDYKSLKYNQGQSKANKWREDQKPKVPEEEILSNPAQGQPVHHEEEHIPPQKPLPVEAEYLGYICTILFGAILAYIQIRKGNNVVLGKHKTKVPKMKDVPRSETSEEEELEALKEIEEQEAKKRDERDVIGLGENEDNKEDNKGEGNDEEGPPASPTTERLLKKESTMNNEKPSEQGLSAGQDVVMTENQIVTAENSDEDWIVVNRDGTTNKRNKRKDDTSTPSKHSDSDNSKSDTDQDEMLMMPYKDPSGDPGLGDLSSMLEKLQIRPDPNTPMKEKLQMAKIIQTERKLILKQAQFTTNVALKRRSLELQKRQDERREIKELARQDSLREELFQQQLRNDDYHKQTILHVSVLIMVAIWIKVMEFNLFTLPFLNPPASSSYFSFLPTSLTVMYNLASWANAMRFLYGFFLFIISVVLWKTVSSLAPFVVLLFVVMHAWTSLLRGGVYFGFLFLVTSLSFTLARKVAFFRRFPMLKFSILYSINLALAAMVGGIVAHGDPLNSYRINFPPDVFVEQMFSYLY